ncbi:predicted nucleic-acid-binding protein [alpha proteobacterium U9-1i]|nr:predicted nucleic-acid-binding protein [alpha proteobacterium U9-1i]
MLPEARLIRFALGPDNLLVPDVAAKLPGRGVWVGARRDLVEHARRKGGFARALKTSVNAPETLADQTEAFLAKRCLDFIGLAKRAGAIAIGQTQVDAAIRERPSKLMIEAEDGAEEGREKLMSLHIGLWGAPPPAIGCFSASELAMALGRDRVIHASLLQERLAVALAAEIGRLAGFRAIVPASWPTPWRSFGLGLGGADAGSPEGLGGATSTSALED